MYKERFPIAKAGWSYLAALAVITGIAYFIYPPAAVLPAVLFIFTAYFFRNPKRRVPQEKGLILAPADGVVMVVDKVKEDHYLKANATRVSIFLSIFNAHLNRSPLTGKVEYVYYRPGKFLPAFKSHASELNEKNYIGIRHGGFRIMVTQVTGFIARRVVCYVKPGDELEKGEIFGLIKFGSCTEIYLPEDADVAVKPGERVRAGETLIGRLPDEL